ncbi:MAG: polysaccharide biosynthesis protein, partial [Luteibacter sp.]|nr:polysaccharide biosynthesis protein [Luteibacter sp.]
LASRRAIGTATVRSIEDVDGLLGGTFNGSLKQLLRARMGQQIADEVADAIGTQAASAEVFLPEMRETILEMLRPAEACILAVAGRERDAYLKYWAREVGQSQVIVSDVGYAGTIQSHLAKLTGSPLTGAYFALTARASQTDQHGGRAVSRFHDERLHPDAGSTILRHDLLLESILTAPDPQFSHFELAGDELVPRYATDAGAPAAFAEVSKVHLGVEKFIADVGETVGADALAMEFDPSLVQQPLHCLGTGLWRSGAWHQGIAVDDHYSGRGSVAVRP